MPTFLRGDLSQQPVRVEPHRPRMERWLDRAELEAKQQQALAEVLLETGMAAPNATFNTAAADERQMRGVPILGKGVGGAIAGTRPDSVAERDIDTMLRAA